MQGKNKQLLRFLQPVVERLVRKKQSVLLLGPRQVGKTTLVQTILRGVPNTLEYYLQNPSTRLELEANPSRIIGQAQAQGGRPFLFVDEAQKVPDLFDAAQFLIDRKEAQFIFTGSSARKLRRAGVNLLPGRIQRLCLDPLLWGELGLIKQSTISPLPSNNINVNIRYSFNDLLVFGALPGVVHASEQDRKNALKSYAQIYLEEEIRAEALTRKIGAFSRFLELAANESGTSPNLTKLSNESGVSQPAIKEFYRVLEDTLVVERVDPFLKHARKRILSTPRYYLFDLGVRNALARLPLDHKLINAQKGILFEHAVVLEIIRRIRVLDETYTVHFWRTSGGAEVDCIIDTGDSVIPIEIKASANVSASEIKGLKNFLEEYQRFAKHGYVITMGERKEKLAENITALPWFYL